MLAASSGAAFISAASAATTIVLFERLPDDALPNLRAMLSEQLPLPIELFLECFHLLDPFVVREAVTMHIRNTIHWCVHELVVHRVVRQTGVKDHLVDRLLGHTMLHTVFPHKS